MPKPITYRKRKRAKNIQAEINFQECPECQSTVVHDEQHALDYCTQCGLVTRASTPYIAGQRIKYPYSILII